MDGADGMNVPAQSLSAVVTGAARGIGAAAAEALADHGYIVICVDRKPCDETVRSIRARGGEAASVVLDVSDALAWTAVVDAAVRSAPPAVLANVAGHGAATDTALDLDDASWDRVMSSTIRGAWYGIRALLPAMLERRSGSIVNIASVAGLQGIENTFSYATAKGGLVAMTRQIAAEYGRKGIRCNAVAPGITATPGVASLPDDLLGRMADQTALGRVATSAEVGDAIAFLASPASAFITGAVLHVDGGTVGCSTPPLPRAVT